MAVPIYSPTKGIQAFPSLCILTDACYCLSFQWLTDSYSERHEVTSHFDLCFPNYWCWAHFCVPVGHLNIFFVYFSSFAPFLNCIICCLLLSCMSLIYLFILDINPLSDMCFANILSKSIGCLFILLVGCLFLLLCRTILMWCSPRCLCFRCHIQKNHCQDTREEAFSKFFDKWWHRRFPASLSWHKDRAMVRQLHETSTLHLLTKF